MELNVIAELAEYRVPIPVIVEYFNTTAEFNEEYTRAQVESVIARQYSAFSCETVLEQAEQFCLGSECAIYRNEFDNQTLPSSNCSSN